MTHTRYALSVTIIVLLCGCHVFMHTKPVYREVPVAALKEVAAEIERAVQEGNRTPGIRNRGGVIVESDAVRQAVRTRAARATLLNDLRDTGHAWECRNGLVSILRSKEYRTQGTRFQRDRDALIVYSENQDRWTIYETILRDSDLPHGALSAVQLIFHEARLNYMPAGQKFEDASGDSAYVGGQPPSPSPQAR